MSVEIVDEHEDIVDCMHSDTLTGAIEYRTLITQSNVATCLIT